MTRFSAHFSLNKEQHELDFVDIDSDKDTPVYVDPYALEIRSDIWANHASEHIRVFFEEVLEAIRTGDLSRAEVLMGKLREPKETYLGVSRGVPEGRGVGTFQAKQLIKAIRSSKAYSTGLLSDLSEMALYVEGIDRDKISDLTTNIIRGLLVEYTHQQCDLFGIPISKYTSGPPIWDIDLRNWRAQEVQLSYVEGKPILLVPKYIVRRRLSLDSQEFYNKQITDFLVEETKAQNSLVQALKGKPKKVHKKDVRQQHPKSKSYIAEIVAQHPELLGLYKDIARQQGALQTFDEDGPDIRSVCSSLAGMFARIPTGADHATEYQNLILGTVTALFYPNLILPKKEWKIHEGRKRIDIVYTNSSDNGFFSQRRNDSTTNANVVIVECKNYSEDVANEEIDQLLGRFDDNRGKFGILACRSVANGEKLKQRCLDAAIRKRGYIITLTDNDLVGMLGDRAELRDANIERLLFSKYRELLE